MATTKVVTPARHLQLNFAQLRVFVVELLINRREAQTVRALTGAILRRKLELALKNEGDDGEASFASATWLNNYAKQTKIAWTRYARNRKAS